MIISNYKKKYTIELATELLTNGYEYNIENSEKSTKFIIRCTDLQREKELQDSYCSYSSGYDDIIKLTVLKENEDNMELKFQRPNGSVNIKYDKLLQESFNSLKEKAVLQIQSIDNIKFKELFPEFDEAEDRNMKLDELLNSKKEVINNKPGLFKRLFS